MAEATDVTSVYEFVHFHFLYINYKMSLFKMSSHVGNLNSGGLYRWLYDYHFQSLLSAFYFTHHSLRVNDLPLAY